MNSEQRYSLSDVFSYLSPRVLLPLLVVTSWLWGDGARAAGTEVTAYEGQIQLPTYPWWPAVRHPYFRGTDGRNIYPYPMMDNLSRTKEMRTWRTVVLENEYLKVTFLPELGGRVFDVLDKVNNQPMFYVNHAVKPGLIGQCGAWISGGIEFNTGPAGHTVSAVLPVDVQILPRASDGSRSVAVGEVEKIYRTRWTVVITLRPGRSYLEETIRIHNTTESVRPYYFWNCTAMPNTKGFQFVYPMTLGSDHGGDNFYTWPVFKGKDLSRGTNYQDASSIFAWDCDQDFFGSYDEEKEYGVVAFANHQLLPGKKAWTWGYGGFGTMHQMDLTDDDGPYNEVQTGPLLTQAEVGRLEPGEAVRWQEWWYPVRGIGGFKYANGDVAANATTEGQNLRLRMIGTGSWKPVKVQVTKNGKELATAKCEITPARPVELKIDLKGETEPLEIKVSVADRTLAQFRVPLDLPVRTAPVKRKTPETAAEFVQNGWQEYLFAKYSEAESSFRKALAKDPSSVEAHTGLAYINLDRDPAAAAKEAAAAVQMNPNCGPAHLAWAIAADRLRDATQAGDHAWKAALDPASAVYGRALAAKICLQANNWEGAISALSDPGPWQNDTLARNRLALAWLQSGQAQRAIRLASRNLEEDPLDAFARSLLWLAKAEPKGLTLRALIANQAQSVLELAVDYHSLSQAAIALRILEEFYLKSGQGQASEVNPIVCYWAAYLGAKLNQDSAASQYLRQGQAASVEGVFPHRWETIVILRWALEKNPQDGHAALYLGHLLFALGRTAEGREMWQRAVDLKVAPVIALRALGMASHQLDGNWQKAADYLERANQADPADPIVARDLAQALFALADKADKEAKTALITRVRDRLLAAFDAGKGRSDFVALLARAQSRLGGFAETARLLDSVRITIWEGAREVHDLFEESHLALGKAHIEAGRNAQALAEFTRALEYPANLATGKLEGAREAHIHYLRGQALAALGRTTEAIAAWQKAVDEPASSNTRQEESRKNAREALQKVSAK